MKLHIENYVLPMMAKSAYSIMPFGLFTASPTPEVYRPLDTRFTYRYFMPVRKQFWYLGLNGHLGSYALMLATAARDLGQSQWRDAAYRQLSGSSGATRSESRWQAASAHTWQSRFQSLQVKFPVES